MVSFVEGLALVALAAVLRHAYGAARTQLLKRRHKAPPRVTLLARALNALLWLPSRLKLHEYFGWPMTLAALKTSAERKTRKAAWADRADGKMDYREGYAHAIGLLNARALSPFGKFVAYDYLLRRLMARLKVVDAVAKAGGAAALQAAAPVRAPVFVLGLPRTGTTFLHRLLSLDPDAQYPRSYELLDPVGTDAKDRPIPEAKRVKYWQGKFDLIKRIVPQIEVTERALVRARARALARARSRARSPILRSSGARAAGGGDVSLQQVMHELGALEPEECILSMGVDVPILPCTFHLLVQQPEVVFAWDVSGTYAHHRDQLSLLARRNGTERLRWMLKSPVHLIYVRHLQQVFKDAKIVWNHRDPAQSLPSLASLFRAFAEMFEGADIDLAALGREQLAFWSAALRRCDDDLAAPGALDHAHVK